MKQLFTYVLAFGVSITLTLNPVFAQEDSPPLENFAGAEGGSAAPPPTPTVAVDLLLERPIISPSEGFFWVPMYEIYDLYADTDGRLNDDLRVTVTREGAEMSEEHLGALYLRRDKSSFQRYMYWRADEPMPPGRYTVQLVNMSYYIEFSNGEDSFSFPLEVIDTSAEDGGPSATLTFIEGEIARAGSERYVGCCEGCPDLEECISRCQQSDTTVSITLNLDGSARTQYERFTWLDIRDQYQMGTFVDELDGESIRLFIVVDQNAEESCFIPVSEDYASQLSWEGDPVCVAYRLLSPREPVEPSNYELELQQNICDEALLMGGAEGGMSGDMLSLMGDGDGEDSQLISAGGCSTQPGAWRSGWLVMLMSLLGLLSRRRTPQGV